MSTEPEQTYELGDLAELRLKFTNPKDTTTEPVDEDTGEALIDPTSITLEVYRPDNQVDAFYFNVTGHTTTLARDGQGVYHVDYPTSVRGTHAWRARSTGEGQAAGRRYFHVRSPAPFSS